MLVQIAATMTVVRENLEINFQNGPSVFKYWQVQISALAIATLVLRFIRAKVRLWHLADEGYIDADAGKLLRYRKMIGADQEVYCDIKKTCSSCALWLT